jgi:hypothetical protein
MSFVILYCRRRRRRLGAVERKEGTTTEKGNQPHPTIVMFFAFSTSTNSFF